MFFLGCAFALLCGLANSAAAALEKHQMMQVGVGKRGLSLLASLGRSPGWLLAMGLSLLAWLAEAGSLALVPVPVVTSLRSLGRGGLVFMGHRWLGERFRRIELLGVILLAVGGIVVASTVQVSGATSPPLSDLTEVLVGLISAVVAWLLARSRSGVMMGAAVGVLFVATGVFTKEISDRVVRHGDIGIYKLLLTPGPWLMIALSVWSLSTIQHAFTRSNAASVSAASTTVSANGLIIAGVVLYHQPLASGATLVPLIIGIVLSAIGAIALAGQELDTLRKQASTGLFVSGAPESDTKSLEDTNPRETSDRSLDEPTQSGSAAGETYIERQPGERAPTSSVSQSGSEPGADPPRQGLRALRPMRRLLSWSHDRAD